MYDKFILIVDDEQELLTLIKTIFERAGYTKIMTATSGEMALQIIRETLPDMVILDVMLPGMDLRYCKKSEPSVNFRFLC